MNSEKPYLECFFVGMPSDGGVAVYPISQDVYHALEGITAEVNIPFNTPVAGYCFVVMLLHRTVNEPAIMEMLNLQQNAEHIVSEFLSLFKPPAYEEGS